MQELSIFDFLPDEEAERFRPKKSTDWKWTFADYPKEKNGLKVFSCFACGGGSTMGYKLAGCEVLGCCEIDPKMNEVFNHIQSINPNVKFLFENVGMKKESEDIITNAFQYEPVKINSRLVSAQDRKRLYWTNFPFTIPEDKHISASDLIGTGCVAGAMRGRRIDEFGKRNDSRKDLPIVQQIECRKDNKFNCVTTVQKDNVIVASEQRFFPALTNRDKWRYLTANEAEKLQTLPAGYTDCVSEGARFKAIGNSWTVDVIAHILKSVVKA